MTTYFQLDSSDRPSWLKKIKCLPRSSPGNAHIAATIADSNFKGVALASNGSGNFLYLADFKNHKIDVLDTNFELTTLDGSFTDPDIPAEYSPFNIQTLNGKLYVAYALANEEGDEEIAGQGLGFVSVYNTAGHLLQHLIEHWCVED